MNEVSERVIDQRLRNRVIESVAWLKDGIGRWDAREYMNQFYDQMGPGNRPQSNPTMTDAEFTALTALAALMDEVCENTPNAITNADLIVPGWLERIQAEASNVLAVFLERGRFGEEVEEAEPSFEAGRAWYNAAEAAP